MTRSGSEYIRGLRDGRSVYLDGERVEDVTTHPAFAAAVQSVAQLFDLADDPANRELMTFPSPRDRRPVNKSWLIPRSQEDLVARRKAHKRWSDASYGLLGRSPDHVASFFAGFAGAFDYFARGGREFADNLQRFYEQAADQDLYVSYAIIQPTIDRAKPPHQQAEPFLYAGALAERDGGVVMRGAQMLATGGVMSDYVYVSSILPLQPGDEDYALSFVVPIDSPGLKLYPRRSYAIGPTSVFDYPLSSRFDETDSLVVFDDVLVPWEHIFIYKNVELTYGQFVETAAHVLGNTQAQIRFWSKLQFLVGLVKRILDRNGQSAKPEAKVQLGELASRAALVEGLVLAAEANPVLDDYGVMRPYPALVYSNQTLQSSIYPEVVGLARALMGGSLIQLPSSVGDFGGPDTAGDVQRYLRWPGVEPEERVKLLKLLWDLISSEFGGRHLQYEMFYAGQPAVVKAKQYRTYDWAAAESLVDHCLASYDLATTSVSTPSLPLGRVSG
jgi:4-hydroxyphenylacetate 3-monooxygenase